MSKENCTIYHPEKSVILTDQIGDGTKIHAPVWIGENVIIGRDCKIQALTFIPNGVELGDHVFIGPGVVFTNDKYPPSSGQGWARTKVHAGVSIGANATILAGVTIGGGARIGAGAVVTHNVPGSETWVGNPARKMEKREIAMKELVEEPLL